MTNTPDRNPNYSLRRAGAALAVGAAALGGNAVVHAITTKSHEIQQRYDNTYDIDQHSATNIEFDVQAGNTPTSIALKFAKPDSANAHNLVASINHQDHDLQPGDHVEIPVAFVDPEVYHPAPELETLFTDATQQIPNMHLQQ